MAAAEKIAPEASPFVESWETEPVLAAIERALRFTSTDETRPHLCAVKIESGAASVRLVATDGHRLGIFEAPGAREGVGSHEALLSRAACESIVRALKVQKRRRAPRFEWEHVGQRVTVRTDEGTLSFDALDVSFPPYQQVIPTIEDDEKFCGPIGLNPRYLADACDCAAPEGRGKLAGIKFRRAKPLDPIVIHSESSALRCTMIVMPMRI